MSLLRLPSMLFIRRYYGMLGGHLKVFDYLGHVAHSGVATPELYLVPGSHDLEPGLIPEGTPRRAHLGPSDSYFVGGRDWELLDEAGVSLGGAPVVNLIQGFAHVRDHRRAFLARPALRVCVSEPLREAIAPYANGPVIVVPNGTDIVPREADASSKRGVFIAGAKNVELALRIRDELAARGVEADVLGEFVPRAVFLERLRGAKIAVLLAHDFEGFFLPGIEAMALGCGVVMPALVGAASYATHDETALLVGGSEEADAYAASVMRLLRDDELLARLARAGNLAATAHSIERERESFVSALRAYMARFA